MKVLIPFRRQHPTASTAVNDVVRLIKSSLSITQNKRGWSSLIFWREKDNALMILSNSFYLLLDGMSRFVPDTEAFFEVPPSVVSPPQFRRKFALRSLDGFHENGRPWQLLRLGCLLPMSSQREPTIDSCLSHSFEGRFNPDSSSTVALIPKAPSIISFLGS